MTYFLIFRAEALKESRPGECSGNAIRFLRCVSARRQLTRKPVLTISLTEGTRRGGSRDCLPEMPARGCCGTRHGRTAELGTSRHREPRGQRPLSVPVDLLRLLLYDTLGNTLHHTSPYATPRHYHSYSLNIADKIKTLMRNSRQR